MGNCIKAKKTNTVLPTIPGTIKNLEVLNESLKTNIVRSHTLARICRKKIEDCILQKNLETAAVIKGKELYLKSLIEHLRESVTILENYLLYENKSNTKKKLLLSQGNIVLSNISEVIATDDVEKILESEEYAETIMSELSNNGIQKELIYSEIQQLSENLNVSDTTKEYRRRTYEKTRSIKQ